MEELFSLWALSSNAVVAQMENDLGSEMLENKSGDSCSIPSCAPCLLSALG